MAHTCPTPVGTWRLVDWRIAFGWADGRESCVCIEHDGHLIVTADGRVMTLLTGGDRSAGAWDVELAALSCAARSYTGTIERSGDRLAWADDAPAAAAADGVERASRFRVDGNRMEIVTAWTRNGAAPRGAVGREVMVWERT